MEWPGNQFDSFFHKGKKGGKAPVIVGKSEQSSRGALLQSIASGKKLKKVEVTKVCLHLYSMGVLNCNKLRTMFWKLDIIGMVLEVIIAVTIVNVWCYAKC